MLLLVSDQLDHVVADPLFTMGGKCELLEVQPALVPVLVVFEIFLDLLDDGPDIVDVVGEEDGHEQHHYVAVHYFDWVFGCQVSVAGGC